MDMDGYGTLLLTVDPTQHLCMVHSKQTRLRGKTFGSADTAMTTILSLDRDIILTGCLVLVPKVFSRYNIMKLIHIKSQEILPDTFPFMWKKRCYVTTLGNPFSDEKTARLVIKQAVKDNYALGSVVIKVEGHDRRTICAYVADMS